MTPCHGTVLLVAALLLLATGESAVLTADTAVIKLGDINADSSLDVRDMVGLVRCIAGKDSAREVADLDNNGRVEFRDLLHYFNLIIAMREKRPQNPQFVVAINSHVLDSPKVYPDAWANADGTGSADYHFIADRPLEQAVLFVEPYYYQGKSGHLQNTQLIAENEHSPYTSSELKRWQAWVIDSTGQTGELTGSAKLRFIKRNTMIDYFLSRIIGLPIEFPLVLRGPWQRLILKVPHSSIYPNSYAVDLNQAGADSVVFNSIDSLAFTIMDYLVQHYPKPQKQNRTVICGPAVSYDSTLIANRLILKCDFGAGFIYINPLDGNERLLQQLGFPSWLRPELSRLWNLNYRFPMGWEEEYLYK